MPHRYLSDYEWSLYIDNNITLKCNPLDILVEYQEVGETLFAFRHHKRQCVFQEAETVIDLGYDDEFRVREQMDYYSNLGFPRDNGLISAPMLLRQHNESELAAFGEEWYEHVLRFSKRDQLAFNFIAWRRDFKFGFLNGTQPENQYMNWPAYHGKRVPASFNDAYYRWRNPVADKEGVSSRTHYLERLLKGENPDCRPYHWKLRQLANKYRSDKGSIYYNAHNYADIYESLFRGCRNKPLRILEVGLLRHDIQVRNPGGPYDETPSLAMWREYFPNAEIYGFDIADFSKAPHLPGVMILQGDMGSNKDLKRMLELTGGKFDIIIDDASHASHHQQTALSTLFQDLNPGGVYIIEDLHLQPDSLEIQGVSKTRNVLRHLASSNIQPTQYIDRKVLEYMRLNMKEISFYDSGERVTGTIQRDALVAIHKRHMSQQTGLRGRYLSRFRKRLRTLFK